MRIVMLTCALLVAGAAQARDAAPPPRGRLVQAGAHRLHLDCRGRGGPTVVVETGLGDFSFDWVLVQERVARTRRTCTYDRAGYAWSEPGPKPRTFDQLNLELHQALASAGERGPFVLVGQSFGGGVVRRYAQRYPAEVAGLVLVEAVGDTQYLVMGDKAQQLRAFASGRPIPEARDDVRPGDAPQVAAGDATAKPAPLDPAYAPLPARVRTLHQWASRLPALEDAENSQRDWSVEYIAAGLPIRILACSGTCRCSC